MMDCFTDYLADNSLIEMSQRLIFPYAQHPHSIDLVYTTQTKHNNREHEVFQYFHLYANAISNRSFSVFCPLVL